MTRLVDVTLVGGREDIAEPGVLSSLVGVVHVVDGVGGPVTSGNNVRGITQIDYYAVRICTGTVNNHAVHLVPRTGNRTRDTGRTLRVVCTSQVHVDRAVAMHLATGRRDHVVRRFLQVNTVDAVQVDGSPENLVAGRADNFTPVGAVAVGIQGVDVGRVQLVQRYPGRLVGVGGCICDVPAARRAYVYPGPVVVACIETDQGEGIRAGDGHAVSAIGIAASSDDFAQGRAVELDPVAVVGFHIRRFERHPRVSENSDIETANRTANNRGSGAGYVDSIAGAGTAGAGDRDTAQIQIDIWCRDLDTIATAAGGRKAGRHVVAGRG